MLYEALANGLISIHAPREGSDAGKRISMARHQRFQSTLPVRGATTIRLPKARNGEISIHAPREGSDLCWPRSRKYQNDFNPRSP